MALATVTHSAIQMMMINDNDNNYHDNFYQAGASYGTGYCDAQCPADLKFINGEANCMDWTGSGLL